MTRRTIEAAVRDVLLAHLSPGFRQSLSALRAKGLTREQILAFVRASVARQAAPGQGAITVRAVEEYLAILAGDNYNPAHGRTKGGRDDGNRTGAQA